MRSKTTKISVLLDLPVQNPPVGNINSSQLTWTPVPYGTSKAYDVAVIPCYRVEDFVRGESNHPQCPTNFARNNIRKAKDNVSVSLRGDGVLLYHAYSCSYGGPDYRGHTIHPEENPCRPNRERKKRGCTCRFTIKQLVARPSDVIITYHERRHVDKDGLPCHGPEDPTSFGKQPLYAMHLSIEIKHWVLSLLYTGLRAKSIHDKHNAYIRKQNEMDPNRKASRDDFLKTKDIYNLCNSLYTAQYHLHPNDDDSVNKWVERNPTKVFIFRKGDNEPFILGIQTDWQLEQIVRFGHNNVLSVDSTFGANKFKYPLYTILAFDPHHSSLPVAWIIAKDATKEAITLWAQALRKRVLDLYPSWRPCSFLVDEGLEETQVISDVFNCRIQLSLWHVRRCWLKRLLKDVHDTSRRSDMLHVLGNIMHFSISKDQTMESLAKFKEDFSNEVAFLSYFEGQWMPQIGCWLRAKKDFAHSNQEMNGAIEFYRSSLKQKYVSEIQSMSEKRLDWLIFKLINEVHSYFWFAQYVRKNGFNKRFDSEHIEGTAWQKASEIPNDYVSYDPLNSRFAKICSQRGDLSDYHTVWNPGSEYALCDCVVASKGSTCKHVAKLCMMVRGSVNRSHDPIVHFSRPREAPQEFHMLPHPYGPNHMEGMVGGGQGDLMGINNAHAAKIRASLVATLKYMSENLPHDLCSLEDARLLIHHCYNELKHMRERVAQGIHNPNLPLNQQIDNSGNTQSRAKPLVKSIYRQLRMVAQLHRGSEPNKSGAPIQIAQGGHPHPRKRRRWDRLSRSQKIMNHAARQDSLKHADVPNMVPSHEASNKDICCPPEHEDHGLSNHTACRVVSECLEANALQRENQQEQWQQMLSSTAADALQGNSQHKQWLQLLSNGAFVPLQADPQHKQLHQLFPADTLQVGIEREQLQQPPSSSSGDLLQGGTGQKQC